MSEAPLNPPSFHCNPDRCIACGACVRDCPAGIIALENRLAVVAPEDRPSCIACQHCLAICPTAAIAVAGRNPDASAPVASPAPEAIDRLIRSRRSFRQFLPEPVDRSLVDALLETTAHAPTGVNARYRRFTLILDPAVLALFRERSCKLLVASRDRLPERVAWLADAAAAWQEKGRDVIFRGAPHLLVATSGPEASTPDADCLIALSYFELAAQSHGVGTVWCGMVDYLLRYLPESRSWLGIPADHTIGYAMLFGRPAITYARTAQHQPEAVAVVDGIA
ncbi:MAG: nitroreductase family protein [Planctomycetes bacterium]|nr:nitroreductase family protein [Planctomycetota bacterium]